jgi:hypothetical protein
MIKNWPTARFARVSLAGRVWWKTVLSEVGGCLGVRVTMFSVAFHLLLFRLDQGQGKSIANTLFAVTQLVNSEKLVDRGYSPDFSDLIKAMLRKNPMERPTSNKSSATYGSNRPRSRRH